jgi:hypothetical protein
LVRVQVQIDKRHFVRVQVQIDKRHF